MAAQFIIDTFSFFMSFVVAAIAIGIIGVVAWAGNYSFNIQNWRWRSLFAVGVVVLIGCQFGFAAANADQHNGQVEAQRFYVAATRDLKSEHFRIAWLVDNDKTVGLLVGRSNCLLPALPVAHVPSRNNPVAKWRPVISTSKQQFGLESGDLRQMAAACIVR